MVRSSKPTDHNPWGWVAKVKPEQVTEKCMLEAYRISGFQSCVDAKRNCKRNPYCFHGLGEKKWKEDSEGEDEQEGAAFRCEGEYAGLQNLGATCYVNSLLQLWFHNPIFRPAILKWMPSASMNVKEVANYKPNCPLAQLQAIFARLRISKRSKIDPSDFVSSLLLNTGEQQDAQEFAKLFMDFIVKLLTDYGDEQIRRLIAQSFNGQLQYETECLGCKNRSRRSEGFTELNLSVKKNLSESLDELLADETISDDYMCSNCHKKNTAKRRMQLVTLPPILNLQLLRFVYDREAQRRKKVTQNISFPEVLEMQSRIFGINPDECDTNTYKYHLTAVLIHNGQSASSGHYVAQIKDLRNGEWLKFNDEFVDPVSKGRNQKTKDPDYNEERDNDKKSKPKNSKNSPSLTSSGAYMLVYTLDQYIQKPEPDPELHQYLIDLVQREDESFEREISKNKSEKDFEQAVRNQRRKEVGWLYDIGKEKEVKNGNGKVDSDTENEGPKPKVARYDNDVSVNTNKGSTTEIKDERLVKEKESQNTTNGIGTEVSVLPKKKDSYDTHEIEFVSIDWIGQWLDPGNPVPPIENGMLLCKHKKLAPPCPGVTPCLYRIVPLPLANVWYEHYQGGPRLRHQDLCKDCVKSQCRKIRALTELDEDHKQVCEITKQFETETSSFTKQGKSIPASLLEDKVWISKESLKNWKKLAKNMVENDSESGSVSYKSQEDEVMTLSEDVVTDEPFNRDLFCEHGNLSPEGNSRRMIPIKAWTIIKKYFKDPIILEVKGSFSCDDCRTQERATSIALQQNKEVANTQKAALADLYHNRNRPDFLKRGEHYIVPMDFVLQWRRFIKEPSRHEIVKLLNNELLICEHDKFKYPVNFVSEFSNMDETDEVDIYRACPVYLEEWNFIKENFEWDREISAIVTGSQHDPTSKDGVTYEPDICGECSEAWLTLTIKKQFEYVDSPIYIVKREKGEPIVSEEEEEPPKEEVIVTGKREIRKADPLAWMAGFSSNSSSIRRSNRPRSSKGEKVYKVSSSLTIKELKSKICPDFKALLSDQHLFFDGTELNDLQKSLSDYRIPVKAKLYLEIDTAENGTVDEPAPSVETGFQGTLLIGGNSFGDTRSPVQN